MAFFLLKSITHQDVYAQDNLYLTGYIRAIDRSRGIVTIFVTTPSCEGSRQFFMPEDAKEDFDPSLIGKTISFFINSSVCEKGKIYQMIFK
ncbi:MAG: hypothetical protein NZ583_08140 [Desulfobacterota bacterium]|nr:hypothetical protein [Thermodesulfobacteriota bacterium]MDW8002217.1 hypothetical protein [Deltaproteobacteria bacterium]